MPMAGAGGAFQFRGHKHIGGDPSDTFKNLLWWHHADKVSDKS